MERVHLLQALWVHQYASYRVLTVYHSLYYFESPWLQICKYGLCNRPGRKMASVADITGWSAGRAMSKLPISSTDILEEPPWRMTFDSYCTRSQQVLTPQAIGRTEPQSPLQRAWWLRAVHYLLHVSSCRAELNSFLLMLILLPTIMDWADRTVQ